jgi:thiamine-monophosphate kinase
MQLSEIGEFGLIRRIERLCRHKAEGLILGIGDDSAVIKGLSGFVLITSDVLIEGVHFDLRYTTPQQLGHKALAVNISDIFAMGGRPRFFLLDIGIPHGFDPRDVEDIYRGLNGLARRYDVSVIGGDTSLSRKGLLLCGTLIGESERPIRRSGAGIGDGIFVTGTVGDSAMGLELLKRGYRARGSRSRRIKAHHLRKLIKRHLTPEPVMLSRTDDVTSMIDISDGLLMDLGHLCDGSNVGALIYKDRIPLSEELRCVASALKKDPYAYALGGGEDYHLLFTSPSRDREDGVRIGEIIKRGRYIIDETGRRIPFKAEGYEHFKIRASKR